MKTIACLLSSAVLFMTGAYASAQPASDVLVPYQPDHLSGRYSAILKASPVHFEWKGANVGSSESSLEVSLDEGEAWEIVSKSGTPMGFFFVGTGSAKLKPSAPSASMPWTFKEASFISADTLSLPTPPVEKPGAAPSKKFLENLKLDRARESGSLRAFSNGNRAFMFALARKNAKFRFRLAIFEKSSVVGQNMELARQETAPKLLRQDLSYRQGEQKLAQFEVTNTLETPVTTEAFLLRMTDDFEKGGHARPKTIEGVSNGEGEPLEFYRDVSGDLLIFLSRELMAGARETVRIRYSGLGIEPGDGSFGNFKKGVRFVYASSVGPSYLDTSSPYESSVQVCVAESGTLVHSGIQRRKWSQDGLSCVHAEGGGPGKGVLVLMGPFELTPAEQDGFICKLATIGPPSSNQAKMPGLFHVLRSQLAEFYGPFPWKEFSIVDGKENVKENSKGVKESVFVKPASNLLPALPLSNQQFALAVASVYWGGAVRGKGSGDESLVDAMALASSALVMEKLGKSGSWDLVVKASATKCVDGPSAKSESCAFLALDALRRASGEGQFLTIARTAFSRSKPAGEISESDFRNVVKEISGQEWNQFRRN